MHAVVIFCRRTFCKSRRQGCSCDAICKRCCLRNFVNRNALKTHCESAASEVQLTHAYKGFYTDTLLHIASSHCEIFIGFKMFPTSSGWIAGVPVFPLKFPGGDDDKSVVVVVTMSKARVTLISCNRF